MTYTFLGHSSHHHKFSFCPHPPKKKTEIKIKKVQFTSFCQRVDKRETHSHIKGSFGSCTLIKPRNFTCSIIRFEERITKIREEKKKKLKEKVAY